MLAQNFKNAIELRIPEGDYQALVKTLGMLERDEIPAEMFDMATTGDPGGGTPGCIRGWAITVGFNQIHVPGVCGFPSSLVPLFYPPLWQKPDPYEAIPSQAAVALRNYLTTGAPSWGEAMRVD